MNILIIEDERPLAEDLARIIVSLGEEMVIKAILTSVEDGIEYLSRSNTIDLIFSDIQLGDGLSFEIFKHNSNRIPVIFCTAFNHYSLEAFETMGIDYILKPFSEEKIAKAIDKYRALKEQFVKTPDFGNLLNVIRSNIQPLTMPSVIMHQGDKIIPISGHDIAFFYVRNLSVYAYTMGAEELVVNHKLDVLEQKLFPFFYRANRQFLVNRKAVKSATQHFHRKIVLSLNVEFSDTILVGKEKVTDFLEWLATH